MKTPRKCLTLGLLDMYGFKATNSGGFESRVFNFATEKVHFYLFSVYFTLFQPQIGKVYVFTRLKYIHTDNLYLPILFFQMKTPRKCRTLGLLDMYGFEASDSGGFESLVFNFATEKVQNVISEGSLVIEQQEY